MSYCKYLCYDDNNNNKLKNEKLMACSCYK